MGEVIAFDGFRKRVSPDPVANRHFIPRVVRAFWFHRQSIERIAARERVGRLVIQQALREGAVPVEPMALRRVA